MVSKHVNEKSALFENIVFLIETLSDTNTLSRKQNAPIVQRLSL